MKDVFSFSKNNIMRVRGEKISGILLDFNVFKVDGTTVCDILDLNKINIEISVRRFNQNKQDFFNGKLDNLLTGLFAQTSKYANCVKKLSTGYKILLDFGGVLDLALEDELTVSMRLEKSAFSSISTNASNIEIETVPAVGTATRLPFVDVISISIGKLSIDELLGNNVVSVIIATDFKASYTASLKAKVSDVSLTALGFEKSVSENLLIAENMDMLRNNEDADIKQLVVYRANSQSEILNQVRLKATFTKPVGADVRILIVKSVVV